ncbi:hypothetical protein ACHHV8_23940 [Paenibacillus sp. TAB 01]|uniref:hypothetical protein n=1 Tax=Paenibacillus sp. TAB 01 TaxID=3368988 RepID=UPI003750F07C
MPLLAEIGPTVTTLQSARAAGVSEPTIFRVFADKTEVLAAYLEEATKQEHTAMELEAIELEAGLEQRVMDLIEVIRLQGERTGAVVNAIQMAAPAKPRDRLALSDEDIRQLNEQRTHSYTIIRSAVCRVPAPDEPRLRKPVSDIAVMILAVDMPLGRSGGRDAGQASITTEQLADLILHGIVN